jgi:tRNA (adenine37-N6)-methyltransferase
MNEWKMSPIGFIRSSFTETSQIPKGLGTQHQATGVLEVLPEFQEGLQDIEGFSHLFIIWVFDRSNGVELSGVPPADDRSHGVFATRSPFRPNPIGLSVVQLIRRDGLKLHLQGIDMLDGTPVLDIKPYLSGIPAEDLKRGWLAAAEARAAARK